jgi:hypothetical protein
MSEALPLNHKSRVLVLSASSGAAPCKIAGLLECPEKLAAMKRAAAAMARPDAERVIVEDALGLLH